MTDDKQDFRWSPEVDKTCGIRAKEVQPAREGVGNEDV